MDRRIPKKAKDKKKSKEQVESKSDFQVVVGNHELRDCKFFRFDLSLSGSSNVFVAAPTRETECSDLDDSRAVSLSCEKDTVSSAEVAVDAYELGSIDCVSASPGIEIRKSEMRPGIASNYADLGDAIQPSECRKNDRSAIAESYRDASSERKPEPLVQKGKAFSLSTAVTAVTSVLNSVNPFASRSEMVSDVKGEPSEIASTGLNVSWNIVFRPEIIHAGESLLICVQGDKVVKISPMASKMGDKLKEAVASVNIPHCQTIRFSYCIGKNESKKREISTRLVSIPAASSCELESGPTRIEILDDISMEQSRVDLKDLFYHRLNAFLRNISTAQIGIGSSVASATSRLDMMFSIKVVSKRARSEESERFGPHTQPEIRRVVTEWSMDALSDSRDKEHKADSSIFCCTIWGYFKISPSEILKSTQRQKLLAFEFVEQALAPKLQADRSMKLLDRRCQVLTLAGLGVICTAMVQVKYYGWMALLHVLNLDSEGAERILSNVQESSYTSVKDDSKNFSDALQRADLNREDKGVRFVLMHMPSISTLLRDPNVRRLFSATAIATRLTSFIATTCSKRIEISRDGQSDIMEWLRLLSTSTDAQYVTSDEAGAFNRLLRTLLNASLPLDSRINCMLNLATILAKGSSGCSAQDLTSVLATSLQIMSEFVVSKVQRPAAYRTRNDKNGILRCFWSPAFEAEAIIMATSAMEQPPLSTSLAKACRAWLNEVDDKEYIQLFSFILEMEKDRQGYPFHKLSTRLRRCIILCTKRKHPIFELSLSSAYVMQVFGTEAAGCGENHCVAG
jgi:hypothetical protein